MHPAHCMPIYLYGSLQYFADVRSANAQTANPPAPINADEKELAIELAGYAACINSKSRGEA